MKADNQNTENASGQLSLIELCPPGELAEQIGKLEEMDRERADKLLADNPAVTNALHAYAEATAGILGAFRKVCVEMRKAGVVQRDATVMLTRVGWAKSRISEACRLINADDKTFKRFEQMEIGVHLALREARAALPGGGSRGPATFPTEVTKEFQQKLGTLEKHIKRSTGRTFTLKQSTAGGVWVVTFKPAKQTSTTAAKGKK